MIIYTDDFDGSYRNIDIQISYPDGRPKKQLKELAVCKTSGLLSGWCKALPSKGFAKDGWRPVVNSAACLAQNIDPAEVARTGLPESCILKLGKNPGGVNVEEIVVAAKELCSYDKNKIKANIEQQHGAAVANAWHRYGTSENADRKEDVFAAQILQAAGY
jgi:hypothetical protein